MTLAADYRRVATFHFRFWRSVTVNCPGESDKSFSNSFGEREKRVRVTGAVGSVRHVTKRSAWFGCLAGPFRRRSSAANSHRSLVIVSDVLNRARRLHGTRKPVARRRGEKSKRETLRKYTLFTACPVQTASFPRLLLTAATSSVH